MSDPLGVPEAAVVIVLQQELPVRVVNVSRSGCLLQVSRPVRVGTVGRLHVAFGDKACIDDVRVARCEPVTASACELGVELLWVPIPKGSRSAASSLALRLCGSSEAARPARPRSTGT
jgi:hypothetical protein